MADEIEDRAVALVDDWIDSLRERLEVRPARFLPTDSVRDHVPQLLADVADRLREPDQEMSSESVETLRALAELRRNQGYHESEVLAELGALNLSIFQEFGRAVGRFPGGADASSIAEVAGRLHQILDHVTALLVEELGKRERQESRELSRRLAEFTGTLLHELKDPLNAATQCAQILATDELDPENAQQLQRITIRNREHPRSGKHLPPGCVRTVRGGEAPPSRRRSRPGNSLARD